jgi:hypothetical protein
MIFTEQKGQTVQIVGPVPKLELPLVDLRHLPLADRETQAAKLSASDATLPFDLEEGPPFRMQLVHLADNEYVLLVTIHHIVCDHWSMQVFRKELLILYEAFSQGRSSPLCEVPLQFVDFISWQRELWTKGFLKPQLAYWKKQLAGPVPEMTFHKAGKGKHNKASGLATSRQPIAIRADVLTELKAMACRERVTLFMILVSVLDALLYLRTGQRDIRMGTTVANRSRRSEDVMGNCLNAVILRTQLFPEMTFPQLLKQVRDVTLSALVHQDVPFGYVAQELMKRHGSKNHTPLFQVMFIYHTGSSHVAELPGLIFAPWDRKARRTDPEVVLTTLELIFDLRQTSTELTGSVTYKSDSFNDDWVREMVENLYKITERVLAVPDERISNLLWDPIAES